MPPVNDLALVRRRQQLLDHVRTVTGDQLARRWRALPGYTDDQRERWDETAGPVLAAGQSRAIDVQVAYLQRFLDEKFSFDRDALLAAAAIDLGQPFIAFANLLSSGGTIDAAIDAGAERADGVGRSGVQWAARAANNAAPTDRIVGWQRTLDGAACDWCIEVAGQLYHTADSASFGHLRCGCGVDPVLAGRNPGADLNGEQISD